ncbi:MAG: geranylgeranylglycerol-phosphate geranylgeranyltransferase [Bacteroidota bacterium]|nr:geranylgeranylglycerol-phosphate geranylgeranyltransferase [Bacteroidota bacterium]MDP4189997.1 geranylgeranylglycerol-phosphate geranylgeranyltransferase [Bacteroidota bacterium]MDP4193429.1 geranylgeranylglycerol-phosphate geranylgeranyltransferase [Bacteroidota bacterium]
MPAKLKSVIQIIRPVNFLISFLSIVVACLICSKDQSGFNPLVILYAALSGSIIAAAGNVINDILDLEIDRINRPHRVLPSGKMSKKEAYIIYLGLNLSAIFLAGHLSGPAFLIVVVSAFIVFFYSLSFKKMPLFGNIVVALMTALTFIFGGVVVGNLAAAIIPATFAFIVNLIREIIKDIEDIEGDSRNNVITFPAKYGISAAITIVVALTSILFFLTFIPFVLNYYKIEYFVIVMISVNLISVYFLKSLLKDQSKKNLGRLSALLKVGMVCGLLALYLG